MSTFKDKWFEIRSLPRFTEEDTITYLKENFGNGAGAGFTPSQLQIIHRRSCGIPACVNYHAELALGRGISDERLRLEHKAMLKRQKKMPYFIGGAAAVLVMLVSTIFLLSNSDNDVQVSETRTTVIAVPAVEPLVDDKEVMRSIASVEKKLEVPKAEIKQPVVAQPKPLPKPLPVAAPKVTVIEPELLLPEVIKAVVEPPVDKRNLLPVTAADETIPGVKWLKSQPLDNYTIQLAGSPDEKNIIRYITRSSLEGELAYVLLARKNRSSWYVVLHGSFESREEAQRIVDFFPPELRKNKPWIRRFSQIQRGLDES